MLLEFGIMSRWELSNNKKEGKVIGSFECDKDALVETFFNMMNFMGMSNPKGVFQVSRKAVSLKRNGAKFTLTLHNFEPPIKISWTGIVSLNTLEKMLIKACEDRQKVAFVNNYIVDNTASVQLALA